MKNIFISFRSILSIDGSQILWWKMAIKYIVLKGVKLYGGKWYNKVNSFEGSQILWSHNTCRAFE